MKGSTAAVVLSLMRLSHVGGKSDHFVTARPQLGDKAFQTLFIQCSGHYAHALGDKRAGGGGADAGRRAGDDGYLVLQIIHAHYLLSINAVVQAFAVGQSM